MFVVPVKGDKIIVKDSSDVYTVRSYTNLKKEPAVYVTPSIDYFYFADIVEINGVRVDYHSESKTFIALGPIKRGVNLPQPKDIITVKLKEIDHGKQETEEVIIKSVKLHNRKEGISKGLVFCSEKACYTIEDIIDVERSGWTDTFNTGKFKRYYKNYAPLYKD